jgi:hypothetical protein
MEGKLTTMMMILYEIVAVERLLFYLVTITHTQTLYVYLPFFLSLPHLHTNIYIIIGIMVHTIYGR